MLKGKSNSISTQNELFTLFAAKDRDSYIYYDDVHYFLLSDSSESALQKKMQTMKHSEKDYYMQNHMSG